jgi:hypothetical protein
MTPLVEKPIIHILADENGNIRRIATNIAPNVEVVLTDNPHDFKDATGGMTFNEAK